MNRLALGMLLAGLGPLLRQPTDAIHGTTVRASRAVRPAQAFDILEGLFLIGDYGGQLGEVHGSISYAYNLGIEEGFVN